MTSPETDGRAPLDRFYSVIPAGGIGSRLWPLSRADAPKFLHDLTGSGQTLLRDTWDRLAPISGADRIMVVTGRAHRAAVERQLRASRTSTSSSRASRATPPPRSASPRRSSVVANPTW